MLLSRPIGVCLVALLMLASAPVAAEQFAITDNTDLIGDARSTQASHEDTLLDIARRNGLGYTEIKLANQGVDTWLPGEGREIVLPKRFVLPSSPREGLVLNIPEMRLYYYPESKGKSEGQSGAIVQTYPLGVGRQGWSTPYETTRVTAKAAKPAWYPPESIREEHAAEGDPLPRIVPAGPDNPLGDYAMRLSLPSYLIHGTNRPWGVGMRVSHGCIRLYPEDIEQLFAQVDVGTSVRIINEPYKVGVKDGVIYLEAHPHLEEDAAQFNNAFSQIVDRVLARTEARPGHYEIDWELAREVLEEAHGLPVAIGMQLPAASETVVAGEIKPIPASGMQLQLDDHVHEAAN